MKDSKFDTITSFQSYITILGWHISMEDIPYVIWHETKLGTRNSETFYSRENYMYVEEIVQITM